MKANVANYLFNNITSRFPMRDNEIVESDIIEAMVDIWARNKTLPANSNHPLEEEYNSYYTSKVQ